MSFGGNVGITFRETMSGFIADGACTPAEGAARGKGQKDNFKFTLEVSIPRLKDFLASGTHEATVVGGAIAWTGHAAAGTPVAVDGTIVMYRNVTPDGRRKAFDFLFSFRDDKHRRYTFTGEKRLFDDPGFDAGADLSTLYVEITDETGQPAAAGITKVHIDEMLDQLASLQVTDGTSTQEEVAASRAFFTFMNDQLSHVYVDLPKLFSIDPDRFLTPAQWRAISLVATVMLPQPLPQPGPTIHDVVANLQSFLRNADPAQIDDIRARLDLLGTFAPLLQGYVPDIRRWAKATLEETQASSLRTTFELMHRMATLPYFAHPKADAVVGYRRPRFTPVHNVKLRPQSRPGATTYDVVIVGSGVAGSLLADRLTAAGKRVLILEAGPYVAERDMSTDDLLMTARLYKLSGLQIANADGDAAVANGPLTVLQGACVGGGGTVNNAICFQIPEAQLAEWHRLGFPISTADLRAAYRAVAKELEIKPVSESTRFFNPAGRFLGSLGDIKKPSVDEPPTEGIFECLVNLAGGQEGCEGLGLCNSGCGSERKLNALQIHLPRALAGGCELCAGARVIDIRLSRAQPGHLRSVESLVVWIDDFAVEVKAREVILCAGAIGSSALLLAANDVRRENERFGLPVGKRFSANVGSPVYAIFDEMLHERPSLQISHYYVPKAGEGFVIESWYAPPGTLSVTMPGFFEDHWERMMAYARMVTAAPLVGTHAVGTITLDDNKAARIELPLEQDLPALRRGITTLARAFLAGGELTPTEVVAGTRLGYRIRSEQDVQELERTLVSPSQLRLGTGHPQGGNAMSKDPKISVVDEQFRVRGFSNLRVCDASVFPAVTGVNPQWTVMALAHHCGRLMGGR